MKKKAALHNLGCKVNAYELEAMQQELERAGYQIVPFQPGADLYLINTCTVTNIADRKSRQMLHKARKMNPQAIVVAVGCYAQAQGQELQKDEAIDLVIGNDHKKDFLSILQEYEASLCSNSQAQDSEAPLSRDAQAQDSEASLGSDSQTRNAKLCNVGDIRSLHTYEDLEISRTEDHTRAFLKVQDGCNQFCSYCIIPYARGRVRSRKAQSVCQEVARLASHGCKEIVLTGIHLSSYGTDLEGADNLLSLIRQVHAIEGIHRIRLGSLEPGIITEDFAQALTDLPKVCPHFHLSLQSGCNRTLQRMNRHYTREEYREKCQILRQYFTHPALTTDIIVGFPGETEEDFEESREFVDQISFFETHVFPYSRREGTRAAAFPGQLPEAVKKARSRVLLELDQVKRQEYLRLFLGQEIEILIEEQVIWEGQACWTGHSRHYQKALIPLGKEGKTNLENAIVKVLPEKIVDEEILYCYFI